MDKGKLGVSTDRWLAWLYVDALASGKTLEQLGSLPQAAQLDSSRPIDFFSLQCQRFGLNENIEASFYATRLSSTEPTDFSYLNYLVLIKSHFPDAMLTAVSRLREENVTLPSPSSLKKAQRVRRELLEDGLVVPLSLALEVSQYWGATEIATILQHNVSLDKAAEMYRGGITDIDDLLGIQKEVPQEWLDELFAD